MGEIGAEEVRRFISALAERCDQPASLYLIGGGALCLLGNPRRTADIDYVGSDLPASHNNLQLIIQSVARELRMDVESVPIDQFVPVPAGAQERHQLVGQYGLLTVWIFDPYTIALSKLERAFDTDMDDLLFMIRRQLINAEQLERYMRVALASAREFQIEPEEMRLHWDTLQRML